MNQAIQIIKLNLSEALDMKTADRDPTPRNTNGSNVSRKPTYEEFNYICLIFTTVLVAATDN